MDEEPDTLGTLPTIPPQHPDAPVEVIGTTKDGDFIISKKQNKQKEKPAIPNEGIRCVCSHFSRHHRLGKHECLTCAPTKCLAYTPRKPSRLKKDIDQITAIIKPPKPKPPKARIVTLPPKKHKEKKDIKKVDLMEEEEKPKVKPNIKTFSFEIPVVEDSRVPGLDARIKKIEDYLTSFKASGEPEEKPSTPRRRGGIHWRKITDEELKSDTEAGLGVTEIARKHNINSSSNIITRQKKLGIWKPAKIK